MNAVTKRAVARGIMETVYGILILAALAFLVAAFREYGRVWLIVVVAGTTIAVTIIWASWNAR